MKLSLKNIERKTYNPTVFTRGLKYFKSNHVVNAKYKEIVDTWKLEADVRGEYVYSVEVIIDTEGHIKDYHCECEAYATYDGLCKHCVAALLYAYTALSQQGKLEGNEDISKYRDQLGPLQPPAPPAPPKTRSDSMAKTLLAAFVARDEAVTDIGLGTVSLKPFIDVSEFSNGISFTFTLGVDRQYVVKNIGELLMNIDNGSRFSYGKGLVFRHCMEAFDEDSRKLLTFMKKWFYECRMAARSRYNYYNNSTDREFYLSQDALEEFFELYKGQTFRAYERETDITVFSEETPRLVFNTEYKEDGALVLKLRNPKNVFLARNIYVLQNPDARKHITVSTITRYDSFSSAAISPLVKAITQNRGTLIFAEEDIPAYCMTVLPETEKYVTVSDKENRLKKYIPEEMTAHLYLDAPEKGLITGRPLAQYGQDTLDLLSGAYVSLPDENSAPVTSAAASTKHIRNTRSENRFVSAMGSLMDFKPASGFSLEGDDAVYKFLTEDLEKIRQLAVVHISDRLKRITITTSYKAKVGVSLDGGLLSMSIETEGFPPEQLANILSAYREKRKYFRLKDGSFVNLADKTLEDVAQLADGLQLTDKQLASGHVEVPAFRALYLDGLFNETEDTLNPVKNEAFSRLTEAMRSFGQNTYEIPPSLKGVLRGYQETGYRWLRSLEDCSFCGILADDMGLGKSLQLIALILSRYNSVIEGERLPSLIVCPASLILNWKNELIKFAPTLPVRIIMGVAALRKQLISDITADEVVITSYDLLKRDIENYTDKQFHYFAIDEAQFIKNQGTKSAQSVKQIVCKQRFALTGTPIENRLSELWSIFDFLMPGYLYSYSRFKERFEQPVVKNNDEHARAHLRRLITPFVLRRLKSEVLSELPPKVNSVISVDMDTEQRNIYNATMISGLQKLKSTAPDMQAGEAKMQIFALLTRLRQLCCHPSLCLEDYTGESAKLEACMELLNEAKDGGHKVLLFSQFTSMLSILKKRLEQENISYMVLQGSTPKEKRIKMVDSFNEDETDVFLISLKAGGTGLNLTGADIVIHFDPWWNMAAQDQATDRAHRIGQTRSVQVYKLIAADTIEEKILKLQEMKGDLASVIDSDGDKNIMNMSADDMIALLESR